jgi:hypothetical protein
VQGFDDVGDRGVRRADRAAFELVVWPKLHRFIDGMGSGLASSGVAGAPVGVFNLDDLRVKPLNPSGFRVVIPAMTSTRLFLALALLAAAAAVADTPQNHHCKLPDGSFDGTKTHRQCDVAKGEWAKDTEFTGVLKTGVSAVGGETTGVVLEVGGKTYELDVHGDKALLKATTELAGKDVTVAGYATTKKGVEVKERNIIVVSTFVKAAPKE